MKFLCLVSINLANNLASLGMFEHFNFCDDI